MAYDYPVLYHIREQLFYLGWGYIIFPLEPGKGFGEFYQGKSGSGTGAQLEKLLVSCGIYQGDNIAAEGVMDINTRCLPAHTGE